MTQRELARVTIAPARRVIGAGVLAALVGMMVLLALDLPARGPLVPLVLAMLAASVGWVLARFWRATKQGLVLTEEALFAEDGTVIARLDEIESISRGMFAIKPSNGFVLRLRGRGPAAWHPGLWWRRGRRLGVGGVTSGGQTRAMADLIAGLLAAR